MIIKKLFGSRNDRLIKKMQKTVNKINALESNFEKLSDGELKDKTFEFRKRLSDGQSLEQILPEAFAVVREAAKRVKNMRHYDVQLIGGIVLHSGKIAEMRTGEGKTLVATLPVYLNALSSKGVHVVTINDYLASRDAEITGKIYNFLGLTTGVINANLSPDQRREAYNCDITYGTNNEFGFDYLRDNMVFKKEDQVQRDRNFVVIDEVDSILIDEARMPLIISGPSEDSSDMYLLFNRLVQNLVRQVDENNDSNSDYYLDEKSKQAYLTERGHARIEKDLIQEGILKEQENLYSPKHVTKMHYLNACLRAHGLYKKNFDYIIRNQEIVIIDQNTGRAMEGRRWSDGLHQAVEAKEKVKIKNENQTLASITFQNFFKLYDKISGMTGTADTEAFEFYDIYNLEVVVIPMNRTSKYKEHKDRIFGSQKSKFLAIVDDIKERMEKNQPVLVGTASIETSEILSTLLRKKNIKHAVLNAKQHAKEAKIIAQAGYPGNVTIATNMAGRGTDIILGGNWEEEIAQIKSPTKEQIENIMDDWKIRNKKVVESGGLCVLGSERHDSRRVDNQLKGRAGRQGDPGECCFYLSMDDNLLRIFSSKSLSHRMKKALSGGESIQFGVMSRFISKAQSKVEQYHFDIRKNLFEYDNVANEQRLVIYKQRNKLLNKNNVSEIINNMRHDVALQLFHDYIETPKDKWNIEGLEKKFLNDFSITVDLKEKFSNIKFDFIKDILIKAISEEYQQKVVDLEQDVILNFEKINLIQTLDAHWREHLNAMDYLRNSINLRGYAQKDPKNEYKKESFELFSNMLDHFKYEVICNLAKIKIRSSKEIHGIKYQWKNLTQSDQKGRKDATQRKDLYKKVKRNEPCPCNSGKKYKQCHGALN